jgi:hypothetical protein
MALLVFTTTAQASEWSGNVAVEAQQFSKDGLSSSQFNQYGSVSIQPEWFNEWDEGNQRITFVPFARWDQHDEKRTHADIRELSWSKVYPTSELRVGIRKVFWGVTESQHLVDVINQTDLVEGMDGEDKLGQPMINYAFIQDWGTVDFFILPYFRERTFPGVNGRLRTSLPVDSSQPIYESKDKEKHIDTAIRYVHSIGAWDIGLSHFSGTSRDPSFVSAVDGSGKPVLRPVYNLMQQTGIDLQVTKGAWLWKLEAIHRQMKDANYIAATGGFEYTRYGVLGSSSDLGLLVEYLYDDRNKAATTPFENDTLLALRWTRNDMNDTNLLMGVISDNKDSSRLYSIEANRRIGNNMKLTLEARFFSGITGVNNLLYSFRKDDFLQIELAYYF